jgi:ribonuclease HI
MRWAFGALVPLFTRGMHACLGNSAMWAQVPFTPWCASNLRFWAACFQGFNGFTRLWRLFKPDWVMHTDAAGVGTDGYRGGWGAVLSRPGTRGLGRQATGVFEEDLGLDHSTAFELEAMIRALRTFNANGELTGRNLRIFSDSQAATAILGAARATSRHLHSLCVELFTYCIQHDIVFRADWVPREENTLADAISKRYDAGDWAFDRSVFRVLTSAALFGELDVDLFAAPHNTQLPHFFSWGFTLGCMGADALSAAPQWGSFRAWAFPPYGLIPRVLSALSMYAARMCLVVPALPGAVWWPRLVPDGRHFVPWVRKWRLLRWEVYPNLLKPGAHNRPDATTPHWPLLALWADTIAPHIAPLPVPALQGTQTRPTWRNCSVQKVARHSHPQPPSSETPCCGRSCQFRRAPASATR